MTTPDLTAIRAAVEHGRGILQIIDGRVPPVPDTGSTVDYARTVYAALGDAAERLDADKRTKDHDTLVRLFAAAHTARAKISHALAAGGAR